MAKVKISLPRAFSLVEVVLALGLSVFVLVAIFGLLSTGLRGVEESERRIEVANVAAGVLGSRFAAPLGNLNNSPLPSLDPLSLPTSATNALTGTSGVSSSGEVNTADPRFRVSYRIWRDVSSSTNSRLVRVYLTLSWPFAAPVVVNQYELLASTFVTP